MIAALDEGVALRMDGAVATIVLEQRGKRNAMRHRTWCALPSLIEEAEREPSVRLLLLRGAGGHFGAGNDIAEFAALRADPAAATVYARAMAAAMQALEASAKPVVVAIEGVCYGASIALALAGDVRIAAGNAVFAVTPAKLGALYLRSDLHRLVAAIGVGRSKKLIYSAETVGATDALAMGLVDDVVPPDRFEPALVSLIDAILLGSPFTLSRTKQMLSSLGHHRAPPETEESLSLFVEATQGPDFLEGVNAFINKRLPSFAH